MFKLIYRIWCNHNEQGWRHDLNRVWCVRCIPWNTQEEEPNHKCHPQILGQFHHSKRRVAILKRSSFDFSTIFMNKSFSESKIRSELTSMIINRGKTMACRTDLVRLGLRTAVLVLQPLAYTKVVLTCDIHARQRSHLSVTRKLGFSFRLSSLKGKDWRCKVLFSSFYDYNILR